MKDCIVTTHNEIRIDKEKLTLNKDDEDFLLDKEHPYFGTKNKENGLLIFNIWKDVGYGIFKNNLISIIEERISYFSGSLFNNKLIRGIYLYAYNESLLLYLLGKNGKNIVPKLNNMKGKELASEDGDYRAFVRSTLRVQREEDSQPRENPSVILHNRANNNEPVDIQMNYTTATGSNTASTSTGVASAWREVLAQGGEVLAQGGREEDQREAQRQAERYLERTRHL